jgi:hypothetical protein
MGIEDITLQLHEALHKKELETKPISIIRFLVKAIDIDNLLSGNEKKQIVIDVLTKICAGKDGISGTEDDLIPEYVVNGIIALIQSGVIDDVITLVHTVIITTAPLPVGIFETIFKKLFRLLTARYFV